MSSPGSVANCLTENVLVEWSDSGSTCYLGSEEDALQMTLRLDNTQSKPELLLWFRLSVKVKTHINSRNHRQKPLFFVIKADVFDRSEKESCFAIKNADSFIYPEYTALALANAGLGPDVIISRLYLRLRATGEVFMPKNSSQIRSPFIPVSEKVSDALVGLQSLSQAKEFYVYLAQKEEYPLSLNKTEKMPYKVLLNLCERVSTEEMKDFPADFTKFNDGMVCNDWSTFDMHRDIRPPCSTSIDLERPLDIPPPTYNAKENTGTDTTMNLDEAETEDEQPPGLQPQSKKRKPSPAGLGHLPQKVARSLSKSSTQSKQVRFVEPGNTAARAQSPGRRHSRDIDNALRIELKEFMRWLIDIDPDMERRCEDVFWNLGEAARNSDVVSFRQIKLECKATVFCEYKKHNYLE